MKVLVIGANNSGKGTLVRLIAEKTGIQTIGCSSVLKECGQDIATGKLLPDNDVIKIMSEYLSDKTDENFILDGFPRTLKQDEYMCKNLFEPDLIVLIDISLQEVISRAVGRRSCEACGDSYNLNGFKIPKVDGVCDSCGGKLYQREDDKEAVVKARYNEYLQNTYPIVKKYKEKRGKTIIWEFDTSRTTDELSETVAAYINYMLS